MSQFIDVLNWATLHFEEYFGNRYGHISYACLIAGSGKSCIVKINSRCADADDCLCYQKTLFHLYFTFTFIKCTSFILVIVT